MSASGLANSTFRSWAARRGSEAWAWGGRTGNQKEPDHGGIGDEAQGTFHTEQEERRVAEVEHDRERQRRAGKEIRRDAFANRLARRQPGDGQQRGKGEPDAAEDRDRNTVEGAEAAAIDLACS